MAGRRHKGINEDKREAKQKQTLRCNGKKNHLWQHNCLSSSILQLILKFHEIFHKLFRKLLHERRNGFGALRVGQRAVECCHQSGFKHDLCKKIIALQLSLPPFFSSFVFSLLSPFSLLLLPVNTYISKFLENVKSLLRGRREILDKRTVGVL